jgi:hypothetical protein
MSQCGVLDKEAPEKREIRASLRPESKGDSVRKGKVYSEHFTGGASPRLNFNFPHKLKADCETGFKK